MSYYLFQGSYTAEAAAKLVSSPQNRAEVVATVVERMGGKVLGSWLAFGDYDIVMIAELPDNVSAAAFSMAAMAGGAVHSTKTTVLLTWTEGVEALRRASGAGYRPPGG
jgi:uncharacterized protein with GYD domain